MSIYSKNARPTFLDKSMLVLITFLLLIGNML